MRGVLHVGRKKGFHPPFRLRRVGLTEGGKMKSQRMVRLGGAYALSGIILSARKENDEDAATASRWADDDARRRGSLRGEDTGKKELDAQLGRVLEKGKKLSEAYTPTPSFSYRSFVVHVIIKNKCDHYMRILYAEATVNNP